MAQGIAFHPIRSAHLRWSLKLLSVVLIVAPTEALAKAFASKVREKTEIRDYRVYGKTPTQLVSFMKRRPFPGDNGPALSNIRPRYELLIETIKGKRGCKVKDVGLNIRFIMTLPKSMNHRAQSKKTQRVWRGFRTFTKKHEEYHRRIYMRCARDFVHKAKAHKPERTCNNLKRKIKVLLKKEEQLCDQKHLAYNRREFRRVPALPLFRQARRAAFKATKSKARKSSRRKPNWFSNSN